MIEQTPNRAFERILEYLRQTRGFDFTAYKRASLMRRVLKRVQAVSAPDFAAYLEYLQVHPDEFALLFNTILINVTGFFRDPEVWEVIGTAVVPALAGRQDQPVRVWSAGAAAGQEAYSMAMLLAEALEPDEFRQRVKIYATDVDEDALREARRAVYSEKQVADVPQELRAKYFEGNGEGIYALNRELRRAVIFGRHDLIQDAPISRVDLLFCRNTLMYFNSDAQGRIMERFHFSINRDGYLVLGRAEMLFNHVATFTIVNLKRRVFQATRKPHVRQRALVGEPRTEVLMPDTEHARLRHAAFESDIDPQLIVDPDGTLVAVNASARQTFAVADADVGSPLHKLNVSYRPADLRTAIDRCRSERHDVILRSVPWERGGVPRFFDVHVAPLSDAAQQLLGIRVAFQDVTPRKLLEDDLSSSKRELDTAYEELQSTNEELETTNEELQSTVEELETTNEELQSTNEELETMNEELQSTNEELQTMNDELRSRSIDLNTSNVFLEAIFTSLQSGIAVLDRDLHVLVWNARATDMWGLRHDEAHGTSFFTLDIGLPVGDLHSPIRDVLSGAAQHRELTVTATNRKGRQVSCKIGVTPLLQPDGRITGVIIRMDDDGDAAA